MTATANDILLQNVTVIPLQVATAAPSAVPTAKPVLTTPSGLGPAGEKFTATKQRSDFNNLVAAVFLALAIVLIVCRIFGYVATKVGQPRVMGEVIAGLVLGPSLLGAISANWQATFFPTDTLAAIGTIANLGLIFYMFLIGLEVDRGQLKGKVAAATAISNASVTLPMLLGLAIALPLYKVLGPDKKFVAFALFIGVSMSITAFPVLARILAERRMIKRPVGALTIACAAIDDVTAWFLIALATAVAASGTFGDVVKTIAEAAAFTLFMVLVVRRVLARMATAFDEVGRIPSGWFAAIIVGVLLSAYITQEINIAFIFGAFIMGIVMPRHARLSEEITRRIDDFVVTLLLPIFFVYTGLRTNVGLLDRPELWLITLALIAIAIVGKLAGAAIAARVAGYDWRASAVIGTLMNTRGLTELIVLNLALDAGAISNTLFAMLVIMAVVTTLMAGPLLKLLDPKNEYGRGVEDEFADAALAAVQAHPELPVPDRSILVAPQTDAALPQLVALAEPLARSVPPRELIIARLVRPPRGAGAGVRGGLQSENLALERATRAINDMRERLAADGVVARGVALTSSNPGSDLAHIVDARADRPRAHGGTPAPDRRGRPARRRRRAHGARRVRRGGAGGEGGRSDRARSPRSGRRPVRRRRARLGGARDRLVAGVRLGRTAEAARGRRADRRGQVGHPDAGRCRTAGAAGDRDRHRTVGRGGWTRRDRRGGHGRRPAGARTVGPLAARGPRDDAIGDRQVGSGPGPVRQARHSARAVRPQGERHAVPLVDGRGAVRDARVLPEHAGGASGRHGFRREISGPRAAGGPRPRGSAGRRPR